MGLAIDSCLHCFQSPVVASHVLGDRLWGRWTSRQRLKQRLCQTLQLRMWHAWERKECHQLTEITSLRT